ncbi:MAG: hypothetical protein AAF762_02755 [Pseudomonadota bacterium]
MSTFGGGGHDALGPAADVYALGATLYALLIGAPPFDDPEPIHLLHRVLNDPPPRLRARWPSAPPALEAIVDRCLAKDPGMRYPSASALAADLRAHLAGAPVKAPSARWPTRVAHRLRSWRHPLRAAIAAALLTAVVLGTLAYRAQQRRAAVQRYDPIGLAFEGALRAEYMSPPHDLEPARARVRARIQALEEALIDAPEPAQAPIRGAIGRGWLALGETERGLRLLRIAWDDGHRTPAIAYAIGRGLSTRYAEAQQRIEGLLDRSVRRAREAEAIRQFRMPARRFLERGRGAPSTSPSFVEALLLLHERAFDAALQQAEAARDQLPWQYEVDVMIGDIHQARALGSFEQGDQPATWRDLRAADRAYRRAYRSAPSDPHLAIALCGQRSMMLSYAIDNLGTFVETSEASLVVYRDLARVACQRARRLAPRDPSVYLHTADNEWYWAQHEQWMLGNDAHGILRRAWAWAHAAQRLAPTHAPVYEVLSNLAVAFAERLDSRSQGEDPRPWLDLAERYSAQLGQLEDDPQAVHLRLAIILLNRGYVEFSAGEDPYRTLRRGAAHADRAAQRAPDESLRHYDVGMLYSALAETDLRFGRAIDAPLARSNQALRRARRLNPDDYWLVIRMAVNDLFEAEQAHRRRETYRVPLERGVQRMNVLLARRPAMGHLHSVRAQILIGGAWLQLKDGADPTSLLRRAALSLRAMTAQHGERVADASAIDLFALRILQAEADLIAARWRWQQGFAVHAELDAIDRLVDAMLDVDAALSFVCVESAQLRMRDALQRRDARAVQRAERRLSHCLDAMALPRSRTLPSQLALYRGSAALLRAYAAGADVAARTVHLAEADRQWRDAERINRWLDVQLAPLRREARALAETQDAAPKPGVGTRG